jgi:hypothetical protein
MTGPWNILRHVNIWSAVTRKDGDGGGGGGNDNDSGSSSKGKFEDSRSELEAKGYTVSDDGKSVYNDNGQVAGEGWSGSRTVDDIVSGGGGSDDRDDGPRTDYSGQPFDSAFAEARSNLGPGQEFTWNGQRYSTATAEERPDLAGPTFNIDDVAASFEEEATAGDLERLTTGQTPVPTGGGITGTPIEELLPPARVELSPAERILVDEYGWIDNGDGTLTTSYGQLYDQEQGGLIQPTEPVGDIRQGPTQDGTPGYTYDPERDIVDPVSGEIIASFPSAPAPELKDLYVEGYQQGLRDDDLEGYIDQQMGIAPAPVELSPIEQYLVSNYLWTDNGDGTVSNWGSTYDTEQGGMLTSDPNNPAWATRAARDATRSEKRAVKVEPELPVDEFTGLPPSMTDPTYIAPEPPPPAPVPEGLTDDQAVLYGEPRLSSSSGTTRLIATPLADPTEPT